VVFTITLETCVFDQISTTVAIKNFDYVMGSGPISVGPNIEQKYDGCRIDYSLTQSGFDSEPFFNSNLFSFDEETGVLTV
jgi:hypothetical protein